jgi:lipopolysaccharide transport system ATP-binding protein
MNANVAISVENVSKKFSKSLRRSMLYGLSDLSRNMLGLRSHSERLREDEFWAVDDVSFEIKRGETVGLIGPNGSGKTSLLKMINGIFWPDRGRIQLRGRVGALIAVGAGFHPLLTGRENIYINGAILGMSKADIERNYDAIVDFADIGDFLDTPVKHYSSGMFVRLGFAVAVHSEPDILLVDEILAVGDRGFQTKCFKKMGELRQKGTTFVVVSHNVHIIAGFVDWVALLHNGKMQRFDDVFSGIKEYTKCFRDVDADAVEELIRGGRHIRFTDVKLGPSVLRPRESFAFHLRFDCDQDYEDVDIDVAIYNARDPDLFFQATNNAYGKRIDLRRGEGELVIDIRDIPINSSLAKITLCIWAKGRVEQLLWWRVPVEFEAMEHATGKNFVPIEYSVIAHPARAAVRQ